MGTTLQSIGETIHDQGVFTGGPLEYFDEAGRLQLYTLVLEGLSPYSKLLDVGCGCLRGGYWLVRLLDPDCYFGIEPNQSMLQAGVTYCLTSELLEQKRPRFDTNHRFDFFVFGTKFDAIVARAIWSQASKQQIRFMLDGFLSHTNPNAFFLASYLPASWYNPKKKDYLENEWAGKSHERDKGGLVFHRKGWIENECESCGLRVKQLDDPPFNGQFWLKITKAK